ncbi:MAG: AbrB/MazE/SpoVT family DNA-binding domain-containing protein [Methylococcales bacterium]|nr:AbrB/MazE/SpoVT family DNA-binding domain-containing protein [Methylococcales bacterium]
MQSTSVTSKGQITIPKHIRQQLGTRKGSKLEAAIVGNHIELYIDNIPRIIKSTGFAMLQHDMKNGVLLRKLMAV